jgi:hypothetical protein
MFPVAGRCSFFQTEKMERKRKREEENVHRSQRQKTQPALSGSGLYQLEQDTADNPFADHSVMQWHPSINKIAFQKIPYQVVAYIPQERSYHIQGKKARIDIQHTPVSNFPNNEWKRVLGHAATESINECFDMISVNAIALSDVSPIDLARLSGSIRTRSHTENPETRMQMVKFNLTSSSWADAEFNDDDRFVTCSVEELAMPEETLFGLLMFAQGNERVYGRYVGADAVAHIVALRKLNHHYLPGGLKPRKHRLLFTLRSASAMVSSVVVAEKGCDSARDALWLAAEEAMALGIRHAADIGAKRTERNQSKIISYLEDEVPRILSEINESIVDDVGRLPGKRETLRNLAYTCIGQATAIMQSALMRYGTKVDRSAERKVKIGASIMQIVAALALATPGAVVTPPTVGAGAPVLALPTIAFTPAIKREINDLAIKGYDWIYGIKPSDLVHLANDVRAKFRGKLLRMIESGNSDARSLLEAYDITWGILCSVDYTHGGEAIRHRILGEYTQNRLTSYD